MLKAGYIDFLVKDDLGNPIKWSWVEASPYCAGDQGGTEEKRRYYYGHGNSSSVEGKGRITVGCTQGGSQYCLRAHLPWSDMYTQSLIPPEEIEITCKAGEVVSSPDLIFRRKDGEIKAQATYSEDSLAKAHIAKTNPIINSSKSLEEEIVANTYFSCYSELGGNTEANGDENGFATIPAASGDIWYCFAINVVHQDLYISESAEIAVLPSPEINEVVLKLNATGVKIPESINRSFDAGASFTCELSDGFSVHFPANTLGNGGETVSCSIVADPFLPYHAGKRPANQYGYDVKAYDSDNEELTQFSSEVTITLPMNQAILEKLDLIPEDLQLAWYDPSRGTYLLLNNVTIDKENNLVIGKTNHFTEFALIGNGTRAGSDGDLEDALEEADRTGEVGTGVSSGGCGSCRIQGRTNAIGNAWWIFLTFGFYIWNRWRRYKVSK